MLTAYPAVFVKEEDGGYSVLFPDFEGGATCGDTLQDALEMAEECLAGLLAAMQEDKEPLPEPSEMTPELLSKTCAEVEADPAKAVWRVVTATVPVSPAPKK
jgi:predicted RNase H-like HicB family nuclease